MRRFALLMLPLIALGAPTADAAGGTVKVQTTAIAKPLGSGYLVIALCEATAVPDVLASDPDVPLNTNVWCSINGVESTQSAPGGKAATVVVTAATTPISGCHKASATYLAAAGGSYAVNAGPSCSPIGPA